MSGTSQVWRWGVVVPATVAAFAGVIADVVSGTLFYWPLLVPSYLTVGVAAWGSLDGRAKARRLDRRLAELEAEAKAAGDPPLPPLERDEDPVADPLVTEPERLSVGRATLGLGEGFVRLLGTVVMAFMYMIALQGLITFATWARPYWYIYCPVLAVMAFLAWLVVRNGGLSKVDDGADLITKPGRRARPGADALGG